MPQFDSPEPAAALASSGTRRREDIAPEYRWSLDDIFPDWDAWERACLELGARIDELGALQGTLAAGGEALLRAFRLSDAIGQLAHKVWYYASLRYDEDQRDNAVAARRQQAQLLLARASQAAAWLNPELLALPSEAVTRWIADTPGLAVYRFIVEDLYRQQAHVLDTQGERLLSLASRLAGVPNDAYWALSTADAAFPAITLSTGETVTVSYAQYRRLLATARNQADRRQAFRAYHETFRRAINTYAALYAGVCERDWFQARARGYATTLEAALFPDNIPPAVVETLIGTARDGAESLRRYHRLRQRALGLAAYHVYDFSIPLVRFDARYPYRDVLDWIPASVAPLGDDYQARVRRALAGGWIDVYENAGKRSGAYSAPVYGVHPYMLLNYADTLDDVFTLAHELGHSMHTVYAHETQPFVYSGYSTFVAEVPSTLSEALLLDHLLARTTDPAERAVLLQHAIDTIAGTFFQQVLFADFELAAHRLVESSRPLTAEVLSDLYLDRVRAYYGDSVDTGDDAAWTRATWARIPHFYSTPYYVYQYATCFASAAGLAQALVEGDEADRAAARARYLALLRAGSSDYPMTLLARAGVDLTRPETVGGVIDRLDALVLRLEEALAEISSASP